MAESPTVGVRIPSEWLEEINALCDQTGKTKTQVVLEALGHFLGKSTVSELDSKLGAIHERLEALEKKSCC